MLARDFLVVVRTILAAAVGVMDAALWWSPQGNGHVQGLDRQVAFHPVADGPADDTPGMQIQNDGKIQPALACPDITDVTGLLGGRRMRAFAESPFLVWSVRGKVTVQ